MNAKMSTPIVLHGIRILTPSSRIRMLARACRPVKQEKVLSSLSSFLQQFQQQPVNSYSLNYGSAVQHPRAGMSASAAAKLKQLILEDAGGDRV